jgi:hypothetical protein
MFNNSFKLFVHFRKIFAKSTLQYQGVFIFVAPYNFFLVILHLNRNLAT